MDPFRREGMKDELYDAWENSKEQTPPANHAEESPDLNSLGIGENIKNLSLSLKSQEEIDKFSLSEDLPEIERALILVTSPHLVQKLSVVHNLQNLCREYRTETLEKVIPKLLQQISPVKRSDLEILKALGNSLGKIITSRILSPEEIADFIIPKCIQYYSDKCNPMTEALLECIEIASVDVLVNKVVPFAFSRGGLKETVPSRISCTKVLGRLSTRLDSKTIESTFFNLAMSLCQDISWEVRCCMAEQLANIAKGIGKGELTRTTLLNELMELLKDEQAAVRGAAFDCFVTLLNFFSSSVRIEKLIPFLQSFCKESGKENTVMIAKHFGRFLHMIYVDLSDDEVTEFFLQFQDLSHHSLSEIRYWCAYHFPAVLQCCGEKKFHVYLKDLYKRLSADGDVRTRRAISSSFHEVCSMLGTSTAKYLRDIFLKLLKDPKVDVVEPLIARLAQILPHFNVKLEDQKVALTLILPSLMDLNNSPIMQKNWRLQQVFIKQLGEFHGYFTPSQISDKITPMLLHHMNSSLNPVKAASVQSLCILMRYGVRNTKRKEICHKLVTDFCRAKSYWHRVLFIDLCLFVSKNYSRKFFKENFFEAVLELATDPVPNVRMRLCELFPAMKKMIKLPFDANLLKKLNTCVASLRNDKDGDVVHSALDVADVLYMIEPGGGLEAEEDLIDRRKEEEEDDILKTEEKETLEAKKREEEARSEFRKKLAEKEQEISLREKIFGTKRAKSHNAVDELKVTLPVQVGPSRLKAPSGPTTPQRSPTAAQTPSTPFSQSTIHVPGTKREISLPQKPTTQQDRKFPELSPKSPSSNRGESKITRAQSATTSPKITRQVNNYVRRPTSGTPATHYQGQTSPIVAHKRTDSTSPPQLVQAKKLETRTIITYNNT